MITSNKKSLIFFGFVGAAITISFLCLIISLLVFLDRQGSHPDHNEYQYSEVRLSSKKDEMETTKSGLVSIPQSLQPDQFITYLNKNTGYSSVITNLGGRKFECSGTCSCEEETNERRTAGHILSRGFYVAITALSSSMAIQIARNTFQEQCVLQFSESSSCDPSHVLSEVDDCEEKDSTWKNDGIEEVDFFIEPGENSIEYLCRGHCQETQIQLTYDQGGGEGPRDIIPGSYREEFRSLGKRKFVSCETLQLNLVLRAGDRSIREGWTPNLGPTMRLRMGTDELTMAVLFATHHLNEFCVSQSAIFFEELSNEARYRFSTHVQERINSGNIAELEENILLSCLEKRNYCNGFSTNMDSRVPGGGEINFKNVNCVKVNTLGGNPSPN